MSALFRNAVSYLSGHDNDEFVGANIDIDSHQLTIKSVLGDGGYGKVYKVSTVQNGAEYALKRLFVPDSATKSIQQEIMFLRKVKGHPNICGIVTAAVHPLPERRGYAEYLILLEYCPGLLADIIKNAGTQLFTSVEVLRIFAGVCNAIHHLHTLSPPIVHRDIKAENVIISTKGVVKICDFGSATTNIVRPTDDWSAQQRGMLEDEVQCHTTPCYRAPEMIDFYSNHEIGPASDVWALGCFLYYICYFDLPFDDNKLAIVNAKYKTPNEHLVMFAPFVPILRGVFKCDPSERPSVQQILNLLENIAKEKGVGPYQPPFEDFRRKMSVSRPQVPPVSPAMTHPNSNNNSKSSWIGYLKGGAENILKEAKSASEKVVGAVVQASNLYQNEKLDEGQLMFTTVTSRIVAISFPDAEIIGQIQQIVMGRYGGNAYFFNLTQQDYNKDYFNGRILNAGWSQLIPPSMTSLLKVIAAMDRWLLLAPDNIVIVHCQSGLGNTSLAISTYLLVCGLYKSAISALQYYAASRYPNSSSIITASQKRYVEYVEKMLYNTDVQPHDHLVILCTLHLSSTPLFSVNRSSCKPFVEVFENGTKILSTLREPDVMRTYTTEDNEVELTINMGVKGDIRVAVYHARNFIGGKMSAIKMFQFCFNTAFIDPECASLRFPKTRLDGIARHEKKFLDPFSVQLSLSVQKDNSTADSIYRIESSSLGITPPICSPSPEEYNKILSKVPDKGFSKSERKATISQNKRQTRDMVFEEEREEGDPDILSENRLIDIMSESMETKQAPMSDPVSRKSPGISGQHDVLLDFLAPETSLTQSSSAPNLAELQTTAGNGPQSNDDFDQFFSAAPAVKPSAPVKPPGHKREKSLNLMDMSGLSTEDDIINNFDMFSGKNNVTINHPKPPPVETTPNMVFDPFATPLKQQGAGTGPGSRLPGPAQAAFLPAPSAQPTRSQSVGNNMANLGSPLIPTRLGGGSGYNSPVTSRSRNASPRTSPTPQRKNDPFSDFKIDTKTAQIQFDKPAAGGLAQPQPNNQDIRNIQQTQPHVNLPNQPYSARPNYFASTHTSGSVFGAESKPWQQSKPGTDTFGDLLSGQNFSSLNEAKKPQSLKEQRRGELEKTMDPVKLKILDWTAGKENNIRALLSTLGDVLWDGEERWPKPGMHLMIEPNQVKKMYRNASRVVHPDKQVGTDNEALSKAIQTELNDAYADFEEAELR